MFLCFRFPDGNGGFTNSLEAFYSSVWTFGLFSFFIS